MIRAVMVWWWPDKELLVDAGDDVKLNDQTQTRPGSPQRYSNKKGVEMKKSERLTKVQYLRTFSDDVTESKLSLSDYPADWEPCLEMLAEDNVFNLSEEDRLVLIMSVLTRRCRVKIEELLRQPAKMQGAVQMKKQLEKKSKMLILRGLKVIGSTIHTALFSKDIFSKIGIQVVIVDESSESLECDLVAALPSTTLHLILIGDHEQIEPHCQVPLLAHYNYCSSLMQRMITRGSPFYKLCVQHRMRSEIAELQLDIYPFLTTNENSVRDNVSPVCVSSSVYWWHCDSASDEARVASHHSYNINMAECIRVLALCTLLVEKEYIQPETITVLAGYSAQVYKLKEALSGSPELAKVVVSTVDGYQGAENRVIILSLVRSNGHGEVGFLAQRGRKCVSVSRARCALYIIGDILTFNKSLTWQPFIRKIAKGGLFGRELPMCCLDHPVNVRPGVETGEDLIAACRDNWCPDCD